MDLLRVKGVAEKLNIGISSVWYLTKNQEGFPKPFKLSPRVTVWKVSEIEAYIDSIGAAV